eukprot:323981-Amorphochlora_amoeboformis.AAC.1
MSRVRTFLIKTPPDVYDPVFSPKPPPMPFTRRSPSGDTPSLSTFATNHTAIPVSLRVTTA